MSRDLVGYGGDRPDFRWPNGARLAVSVVVNFEEGAERQVLDGDPSNERIGEVISVVTEGRPDPGQAQIPTAPAPGPGAWPPRCAGTASAPPCLSAGARRSRRRGC